MDARMAQLIAALTAQKNKGVGGGANLSGVGGRALPFAQGLVSPKGVGGYWSTPISFNPYMSQIAQGLGSLAAPSQGVGNASLGAGTPAAGANSSNAGIGTLTSSSATPTNGGATDTAPAVTPGGFYQSDPGTPQSSYIPPAPPTPMLSVGGTDPTGSVAHANYGGLNMGDPTSALNYYRSLGRLWG